MCFVTNQRCQLLEGGEGMRHGGAPTKVSIEYRGYHRVVVIALQSNGIRHRFGNLIHHMTIEASNRSVSSILIQ